MFQKSVLKIFNQNENLVAKRYATYQNYKAKAVAIKSFKEDVPKSWVHNIIERLRRSLEAIDGDFK